VVPRVCNQVMAAVRNLANQNRTIVCTIHQPSIEVFALFDKLILMAHGQQVSSRVQTCPYDLAR
jgi:ABC-type multidrug transport system ATPase subunit